MAQRYGKIVNVGGTFGMRGRAGRVAYSASKWGLRGIDQELRARTRPLQHQRQLRRARHGRRAPVPQQSLPRHGPQARHLAKTEAARRHAEDYALSASRPTATSPTPACSWPATYRARSRASICRSTAAGRRYEDAARRHPEPARASPTHRRHPDQTPSSRTERSADPGSTPRKKMGPGSGAGTTAGLARDGPRALPAIQYAQPLSSRTERSADPGSTAQPSVDPGSGPG